MRIFTSARRIGVASAATLLLAGLGVVAVTGPANAAPRISWRCSNGFFANNLGRLAANGCTGSGTTGVYVVVDVLDETTGPEDVLATLYCSSFAPSSQPGTWGGTSCYVYSYG